MELAETVSYAATAVSYGQTGVPIEHVVRQHRRLHVDGDVGVRVGPSGRLDAASLTRRQTLVAR